MYKLTANPDAIVRLEDNTTIPRGHRWWAEYQKWCEDGNTPLSADPVTAPVPEVPMWKARIQLLKMGLLSQVDAAIQAMPGEAGEEARTKWEYATAVRGDDPTAQYLMAMLGFTTEQVDAFFTGAAAL